MASMDPVSEDNEQWKTVFVCALRSVQVSPCMMAKQQARNEVEALCKAVEACAASDIRLSSAKLLVEKVKKDILFDTSAKITPASRNATCARFQRAIHGSNECADYLDSLAENFVIPLLYGDMLLWLLVRSLMKQMLVKSLTPQLDLSPDNISATLNETELQVLRYVGGFIVMKLKRCMGKELQPFINKLVDQELQATQDQDNFLEYTKKLVDAVDRGGLYRVNDKFFIMLIGFEKIVKPHMSEGDSHMSARLQDKIKDSAQVCTLWDQIVKDEFDDEDEDKVKVFENTVKYYVDLRVRAFTNAYKFLLGKKQSAKQRKSLRHDLD